MIRLLGAITGSALALATLLVFVGVPQFKFDSTGSADVEQSVVTLPLPTQPVDREPEPFAEPAFEPAIEPATEPSHGQAAEAATPPPESVGEPQPAVSGEVAAMTEIAPEFGAPGYVAEPFEAAPSEVPEIEPDTLNWYAFWSPFRSEIAATGFVDQLERVTGLDYRVVKVKPGVYEVAFAYSDDTEIAGNLSRITAATGLEMPEG